MGEIFRPFRAVGLQSPEGAKYTEAVKSSIDRLILKDSFFYILHSIHLPNPFWPTRIRISLKFEL